MMRTTISPLFIITAAFFYSIELSSQSTRNRVHSGRVRQQIQVYRPPPLVHLRGVHIPVGDALSFRKRLISVDQNHAIIPYTLLDGRFCFIKVPENAQENYEAEPVSIDDWLLEITAYAQDSQQGDWIIQSAVETVRRLFYNQAQAQRRQAAEIQTEQIAARTRAHENVEWRRRAQMAAEQGGQDGEQNFASSRLGVYIDTHHRAQLAGPQTFQHGQQDLAPTRSGLYVNTNRADRIDLHLAELTLGSQEQEPSSREPTHEVTPRASNLSRLRSWLRRNRNSRNSRTHDK